MPFLNLVRPLKIVNDVWRAGARREPGGLVVWWWITNIADSFFSRVALNRLHADTLEEMRNSSLQLLASDVFTLLPAVLAILVVRSHTREMEARAAAIGPDGPQPAPAPFLPPAPRAAGPAEPAER